jgi:Tfp pilus assembly protein PilO
MIELMKGKVTPKDWMIVGGLFAGAVVIVLGYWFVVRAARQETLGKLRQDNQAVQADLREAQLKQQRIDALREETRKIEQLVSEFDKRLPSEREIPMLINQFERMANDVGLHHSLTPQSPQRDERKETIPYKVRTFGSFHQTVSFINRLERFERYLKISDLKIDEEEKGISEASFTLSTFRFLAAPAPQRTAMAAAGSSGTP